MLDAIQKSAEPALSKSAELALQVAHYNALQSIIYGIIPFVISILVFIFFIYIAKTSERHAEGRFEILVFYFILSGILLGIGCTFLFNIYNWIGIWNPQVYLAHEIMSKFLN